MSQIILFLFQGINKKMSFTSGEMFDIKVWDDIEERCNNETFVAVIDNRVQLFHPINTEDAINTFTQVGHLLQLAYAGSKCCGPCSVHVIEVLSHYQDLVKNTVVICTTFTNVALKSLSFHKPALIFAEKGKPNKAIGFLGNCANLAGKMANECDKMVIEIERMSESSLKALMMVKDNYIGTETEKQAITNRANKLNVFIEKTLEKTNNLKEEVEKAKFEEAKHKDEDKKDVEDKLIIGLLGPISYVANGEIKSNELKEILQKEARAVNDDLTQSIESLKQLKYTTNELHASITCLEISIKLLEKVKTMFSYGKHFWTGVKLHSESLKSSKTATALRDDELFHVCKKAFVLEIKTSGLGWLAIGKICRQAALNIRSITHGVDRTYANLFDKIECEKLIQKLSDILLSEIVEDNEKIEDVKSDWLYEVLIKASATTIPEESEQIQTEVAFNHLDNHTEENDDLENDEN